MAASSLNQIWTLVRRYLLVLIRSPILSSIRILLWPGLLLGLLTYLLINIDGELNKDSNIFANQLPYVVIFLTPFHVYSFSEWLVKDRASGFKSLMISMGLNRASYHAANTISMLCLLLPLTLYIGIMSATYVFTESKTSSLTIVALFISFTFHIIGVSFALVSFITSTSYVSIIFIFIILQASLHTLLKLGLSQLSETWTPAIMFVGLSSPYEVIRIFSDSYILNRNNGTNEFRNSMISQSTERLLLTCLVWTVLTFAFAMWFEQVCPWQNDSAVRGPCFCLTRNKRYEPITDDEELATSTSSRFFERLDTNREVGIRIQNVSKSFGNVPALQNISFDIHKGETTLLLGHNGAGKSTLMNIILGMLQANAGWVHLGSRRRPIEASIGVCPQTSVLDNDLTVRQHLELFCDIKSDLAGQARKEHIRQTLDDVSLTSHANKVPSELSGGMRRKLSLAMAFVGNSNVLILDEPSSGLDPDSRVFVWNAIRRYRSDRTVLLSTQHMEEADYLGDRIAIMSSGQIVCCGSSVFLSKLFGSGYKLRIECQASNKVQILSYLRKHFSNSRLSGNEQLNNESKSIDSHIDFVVELQASDKSRDYEADLIRLLEDIETNGQEVGIISFGLKSSSIEDVMLETSKHFALEPKETTSLTLTSTSGHIAALANTTRSTTGGTSFLYSFLVKHMLTFLSDWKTILVFRVLIPSLGAFFAINQLDGFYMAKSFDPNLSLSLMIFHMIYYPTLERTSGFKTVQLASHASAHSYWLAFAVVDLTTVIFNAIIMNVSFILFYDGDLVAAAWKIHTIITVGTLLFGLAAMIFAYVVSNLLNDSKSAIGYNVLIYSISLITFFLATIINLISSGNLSWLVKTIGYVATAVMPTDAFQKILIGLLSGCYIQHKNLPSPCDESVISDVVIGSLCLIGQILVYSVLMYYVEKENVNIQWYLRPANTVPFLFKQPQVSNEHINVDDDVVAESNKSLNLIDGVPHNLYSLVAANLSKSYYVNVKVVQGLSFTVGKGECFGLLGVNGAGKTTTFSMLTGQSRPDSGKIWANGHYVSKSLDEYRNHIGYDPQATPELSLSPYQALFLMARLRNINEHSIPMLIKSIIELMDMSQHLYKPASQLSGGTKRKLALGMALIGNPSLVALDEPTAGVDPMARRGVWQLLKSLRSVNKMSIVISSHAMEECEAICDRISIMARGRLRCIGTFLHLRSKFAQGCTLRVQFSKRGQARQSPEGSPIRRSSSNSTRSNHGPVIAELQHRMEASYGLNGFQLTDKNVNSATFRIVDNNLKRSTLFKLMRDFIKSHPNVSYIVNDCSLEDIFISIAREQQE